MDLLSCKAGALSLSYSSSKYQISCRAKQLDYKVKLFSYQEHTYVLPFSSWYLTEVEFCSTIKLYFLNVQAGIIHLKIHRCQTHPPLAHLDPPYSNLWMWAILEPPDPTRMQLMPYAGIKNTTSVFHPNPEMIFVARTVILRPEEAVGGYQQFYNVCRQEESVFWWVLMPRRRPEAWNASESFQK